MKKTANTTYKMKKEKYLNNKIKKAVFFKCIKKISNSLCRLITALKFIIMYNLNSL